MELEWDEGKDAENRAKHGLALAMAAELDWAGAKFVDDGRKDYGEVRTIAFGRIQGRLHACVFTVRNNTRRIISLRKSNFREIRDHGTASEATSH